MHGQDDTFDDLDQLVAQLNLASSGSLPVRTAAVDPGVLDAWLHQVRDDDGSDLLLVAGVPPVIRASGRLLRLGEEALGSDDVEAAVWALVAPRLQTLFHRMDIVESGWRVGDPMLRVWDEDAAPGVPVYGPGSWGPSEADLLLERSGRQWRG